MSESNSGKKEVTETAAVVNESKTDVKKSEEVKAVKKTTKAKAVKEVKKATTAKKVKKTEEVANKVATSEVITEKEEVIEAVDTTATENAEVSKPLASTSVYLSIAAGVFLAVTLTIVMFFQDEYEAVVVAMQSNTVADEVVSDASVATQKPAQIAQANYGYQSAADVNQARNDYFDEMRKNQRASYDEAKLKHNERMTKIYESRKAVFERMDQERIDRQNKIKVMREKVQKIQLDMQQKMKAAYDEFYAI